ncbi:MAG: hypothetical protein IPH35_09065, partial [Rhodoferax sp.]|nr:hypothetical protein [Rhodoferax sp.]
MANMALLARQRGEVERALRWEATAALCKAALLSSGWDGLWFCRAYFNDGGSFVKAPMPSVASTRLPRPGRSCRALPRLRCAGPAAMDAADAQLVDTQ